MPICHRPVVNPMLGLRPWLGSDNPFKEGFSGVGQLRSQVYWVQWIISMLPMSIHFKCFTHIFEQFKLVNIHKIQNQIERRLSRAEQMSLLLGHTGDFCLTGIHWGFILHQFTNFSGTKYTYGEEMWSITMLVSYTNSIFSPNIFKYKWKISILCVYHNRK